MDANSPNTAETQSSRSRWFRFSLRTILIVVTVVGLWFAFISNRARREGRAVAALLELNAAIVYDWQVDETQERTQRVAPGPAWLRAFLGPHFFDRVVEVRLPGWSSQADKQAVAAIEYLKDLHQLNSLSLSWVSDLTTDEYRLVGDLRQITTLNCSWGEISDDGAKQLARASGIQEMHLYDIVISPAAIAEFSALPQLEQLSISCQDNRMRSGGAITEFNVAEFKMRDEALDSLINFPQLRHFSAFNTVITDKGIETLSRLSKLERLTVSSQLPTGDSIAYIKRLKNLESLGVWGWKIQDEDLLAFQEMPALRWLDLFASELTDQAVPHVAKLTQLTTLRMHSPAITDKQLASLHGLTNLTALDLDSTSIDKLSAPAKQLRQALPNCSIRLPRTAAENQRHVDFIMLDK